MQTLLVVICFSNSYKTFGFRKIEWIIPRALAVDWKYAGISAGAVHISETPSIEERNTGIWYIT